LGPIFPLIPGNPSPFSYAHSERPYAVLLTVSSGSRPSRTDWGQNFREILL